MKGLRTKLSNCGCKEQEGMQTEGEGTVRLTSSLRMFVLLKSKLYFQYKKELI
jgi:hypothetical protein